MDSKELDIPSFVNNAHKSSQSIEEKVQEMRYNTNIQSFDKGKRKGKKTMLKIVAGSMAILALSGTIAEYNKAEEELCTRDGMKKIESYSPGGGPVSEWVGEKNHTFWDSLELATENIEEEIKNVFESGIKR